MVVSVFGRSVWCGSSNLGVNMQLQQLHPKQLNTIVPTLLGYWFESPTSALVYEYLVNGYFHKFLFAEKEVGQFLRYPLKFMEVSMDHVLIYQCARRAFESRPQQQNQIDIYTPPMVATSWMNWVSWGDETVNIYYNGGFVSMICIISGIRTILNNWKSRQFLPIERILDRSRNTCIYRFRSTGRMKHLIYFYSLRSNLRIEVRETAWNCRVEITV
jgi:hypothetical protein